MRAVAITINENNWQVKCSKCGKEARGNLGDLIEEGWIIMAFTQERICPECAR